MLGSDNMTKILPVLVLKNLILLPKWEVKVELNNELSKKIIMLSTTKYDNQIFIVTPKDTLEEIPDVNDLPQTAVVGTILSNIQLPNNHIRIKISGLKRMNVKNYFNDSNDKEILKCKLEDVKTSKLDKAEQSAYKRKLLETLKKYIASNPKMPNAILGLVNQTQSLDEITDIIAANISLPFEKKCYYMEEKNPLKRAKKLLSDLNFELEVIKIDKQLNEIVSQKLDDTQREFVLKERLKAIQKELKEETVKPDAIEWLRTLENLNLDSKTTTKIKREINKYEKMNEMSPDASFVRNYLETFFSLPWRKFGYDETDLNKISDTLNKTHYGLEQIKVRIIEYCALKKRNPNLRSPIICLVGPPGIGKTTIAMSIAKALNKEFYKISVGGLNDAAELNGHRRTYIGASPGKIIQALIKCGVNNPLLLIDEVDKMTKDYRGDPSSVLLDVLDYPQNQTFMDNYLEEPFDLSNTLFILTANDKTKIPIELIDRLEIIELSSYTLYEKIILAREYLLPQIYTEYNIDQNELTIPDGIISKIITNYTKEAGVRDLKRQLETLIRKILTASIKSKRKLSLTLSEKELKKYLGIYLYDNDDLPKSMTSGLAIGLAWTSIGGKIMPIEAAIKEGNGNICMTGFLKNIMQESVKVSLDYLINHQSEFKITQNLSKLDFHIHALDSSSPKQGPSAGVAITTALLSILLNKPLVNTIAQTGEITLRGDILKVGGIKEKLIGAFNAGIHTVFLPKENKKDLDQVPEYVLDNLEIILVDNYKEIYKKLFKEDKYWSLN